MKWPTECLREPLLTEAECDTLGPGVHRVSYPRGSLLVLNGDHTDFVLYLIDGHVKSVQCDPDRILGIHSPGTFIGELASGAVTLGRQRITIHDLAAFEAIAQRTDQAL